MSTKNNTMSSNVETLDIDLDTIFNAAPSGADMTLPSGKDTKATNNIFSGINKKADFSFADPDANDADDLTDKDKTPTSTGDLLADDEEENIEPKATKEDGKSILESLGDDDHIQTNIDAIKLKTNKELYPIEVVWKSYL